MAESTSWINSKKLQEIKYLFEGLTESGASVLGNHDTHFISYTEEHEHFKVKMSHLISYKLYFYGKIN